MDIDAKVIFETIKNTTYTLGQTRELLNSYQERPKFSETINMLIKKLQDEIQKFSKEENTEEIVDDLQRKIKICEEYQEEKQKEETEELLPFEKEGKEYNIVFDGKSLKDIKLIFKQQKDKIPALINKIDNLANGNTDGAEAIRHTNEKYKSKNVNFRRIWFGRDYRIAYFIEGNTLCIIGIEEKSGKDSDYTRYDSVAEQIELIRKKIKKYENGILEKTDKHYITIKLLKEITSGKEIEENDILKVLEQESETKENMPSDSQLEDRVKYDYQEEVEETMTNNAMATEENVPNSRIEDSVANDRIVEVGDIIKLRIALPKDLRSKGRENVEESIKYVQITNNEDLHRINGIIQINSDTSELAQAIYHQKIGHITEAYLQKGQENKSDEKPTIIIEDIMTYEEFKEKQGISTEQTTIKPKEPTVEKSTLLEPTIIEKVKPIEENAPSDEKVTPVEATKSFDELLEQKIKEEEEEIAKLQQENDVIKQYTDELTRIIPECLKLKEEITNLNSQIFEYYGGVAKVDLDDSVFKTALDIAANNPTVEEIRYIHDIIKKHHEKLVKQYTELKEIVETIQVAHTKHQQLIETRVNLLSELSQMLENGINPNDDDIDPNDIDPNDIDPNDQKKH